MRAVQMMRPGPPSVLELHEIAEPEILKDSDIKIQLKAAGVNPIDTKIRSRGLFFTEALPAVLGCDGAGVIVETGSNVSRFKVGDEVWLCHGGLGNEQGNYAEFTVVNEQIARHKPRNLSFIQAAAAPLVLITAWEALYDRARLQAEQTVLIHAGAGGVGHVAIQLAKHAGAEVCTTVSNDEKASLAYKSGADHVIRYQDKDFVKAVLDWTDGKGVDIVFDTLGGDCFQQSIAAVKDYGDLVTLLDPGVNSDWHEARNKNLRIGFELMLTPMLHSEISAARIHQFNILDQCQKRIFDGYLSIEVGQTFPLEKAADAHAFSEQGHSRGKIVLSIDS